MMKPGDSAVIASLSLFEVKIIARAQGRTMILEVWREALEAEAYKRLTKLGPRGTSPKEV